MLIQRFEAGSLADALAGELRPCHSHFAMVWWTERDRQSIETRVDLEILCGRLDGLLRVYDGKDVLKEIRTKLALDSDLEEKISKYLETFTKGYSAYKDAA